MKFIPVFVLLILIVFFGHEYITKKDTLIYDKQQSVVGGEFLLQNQDGEQISNQDLLNKYTMVLFGFRRCPHICPNQLAIISNILEEVNNKKLQAFFVTVDPLYDDVQQLQAFHEKFDERIQMLTGPKEEIEKMVSDYKVYVSSSETPEDMNHSTIVYIMGKDGIYLEHLNLSASNVDETVNHIKDIIR